jgi:hypothetical protein
MVKMIMSRRNTLSFVPFQLPQHGSQLGELIPHEFSEKDLRDFVNLWEKLQS